MRVECRQNGGSPYGLRQVIALFVGCTIPEIADIVVISPRTADRQWAFARAWLKRAIKRGS